MSAFELDESGGVSGLQMASGEVLRGFDYYVSAVPVDVFKRLVPSRWSTMPYFRQFDELEGIPVINLHMWCAPRAAPRATPDARAARCLPTEPRGARTVLVP